MRKRTKVIIKRLLFRLFILILIIGSFYLYFFSGVLTIHNYDLYGVPKEHKEELIQELGKIDDKRLFFILPGNRVITYHKKEIITLIKSTLTNTRDIKIYPSGLHTLHIEVTPYIPIFHISDNRFITAEGVIYDGEDNTPNLPYLDTGTSTAVNIPILNHLTSLIPKINVVLYTVDNVSIDEFGDIRLFDKDKNHMLIFNSLQDIDKLWSNIISAIDTDPLKAKLRDNFETLQYLDARFGNKVFYKFSPLDNSSRVYTSSSTSQ